MFKRLREDIQTIKERDPAARNAFEIFFMYSGLHAIWWYRASHWCYRHKRFSLARFLSQSGRFWTGIEIHPGATIGKGLFLSLIHIYHGDEINAARVKKLNHVRFPKPFPLAVHAAQRFNQGHVQHGGNPFLTVVRPCDENFSAAPSEPDKRKDVYKRQA